MNSSKLRTKLESVLVLLLEYPGSLRVLTGELQAPGPDELSFIGGRKKTLTGKLMRHTGADMTLSDVILRTIESAGGWPRIVKASREWIRNHPDTWKALIEYFVWVKPAARSKLNGNLADRAAKKHGMSGDDLRRLGSGFPAELAEVVVTEHLWEGNNG
jgi:hypothetical protein